MFKFTLADLSEIHPATEPPKEPGYYLTDHCAYDLSDMHPSCTYDLDTLHIHGDIHYWDGANWYHISFSPEDPSVKMTIGAIGCSQVGVIGRWVGLKEPRHE